MLRRIVATATTIPHRSIVRAAGAPRNVSTTRITKLKKEVAATSVKPTTTAAATPSSSVPAQGNVPKTDESSFYFPGTKEFDQSPTLQDEEVEGEENKFNWSKSYYGLSTQPFSAEVSDILMQPLEPADIEIKPDGMIYLPEIKYRRILNKAFGPGGWGLAPRGEHSISSKNISREYALICHGRFISQSRGEQDFFDISGLPTASEGCKSNALMRCCKDLGIASELWDPIFIRKYKKKYCVEVWAEHVTTKKKKKLWRKRDDTLDYPYKEQSFA
ncbi:mitochondrial genome maintenance MGM101-domain-containing protein [Zychaea mexicana]|uniref:mitochondrial genome maintenance MGM101-domain-containing protein n=1 Tax=Zychaea mexicana TaxID=64656 RepID=UPI0022FEF36C|nr:mitochondrial genome maintenance MGM101-domain-containing protein [Zychaea mexicana]KAI9490920.1 mitochondrial genome maintenance MGM101-domain-containing protein [Zychaea mexicana]